MNNRFLDSKAIGQRIRALRLGVGLSRNEFAKEIEIISGQSVCRWEHGHSAPSLKTCIKICNRFNTSIDELVFGINTKQTN